MAGAQGHKAGSLASMGRIPLNDVERYLHAIGIAEAPARTSPFDPGYDPATLESHLAQSAHLMESLKLSMATWMIADRSSTESKVAAAASHGVPTVAGGGPFEVAADRGALDEYLDLCAAVGFSMIECAEGFTTLRVGPERVLDEASTRGLKVQYELGGKHSGPFTPKSLDDEIAKGRAWLAAGATQLVVEARENARGSGVFDHDGELNLDATDRLVTEFGLDQLVFEAPTKSSQFALIDHLGPDIRLGNVRLEEVLRVEIYRRGLHADSYRSGTQ